MPLLLWWGEEIDFSFVCIHMCSRICISFISSIDIVFVVVMVMYQDRQAMPPPLCQSPNCWSSCNVRGWMEGDSIIVIEDVCEDGTRNLGGRLVLILMRAGILVGDLVVVAVGVMVVVAVGMISISEKQCLTVTEVECLGVGFGQVGGDIL